MEQTWIVVANAGRARIFSRALARGPLTEIDDMVNSAVRQGNDDTESNLHGPTSAGKSIHNTGGALPNKAYEPPQTPNEHETELFGRSVIAALMQGYQQGSFQHLELIAGPQFLGQLRLLLDPNLKPLVTLELNKDYTQLSPTDLRDQLAAQQQKTES